MNYRQWKKNYKKKNGYNPPFEEDKRQQVKAAKRAFRKIPDNASICRATRELSERLKPTLLNAMSNIFHALSDAFNGAGKAAGEMANNYRAAAAAYNKEQEEREGIL